MTYSIKLVNSFGVTTYDPGLHGVMTYVGDYVLPSYAIPGSSYVDVPGLALDGNWTFTGGSPPTRGSLTVTPGRVIHSTTSGSGTYPGAILSVYSAVQTTPPTVGFGFWMKNDAGYITAHCDKAALAVYSGPTTIASGSSIPVVPSGFGIAVRPVSNTGYIYGTEQSKIISSTGSSIKYIVVGKTTSIITPTTGNSLCVYDSSGQMTFCGEYPQVRKSHLVFLNTASSTPWTTPSSNAYLAFGNPGYLYKGWTYSGGPNGRWLQCLPSWTSSTGGGSLIHTTTAASPPTENYPTGNVMHVFYEI